MQSSDEPCGCGLDCPLSCTHPHYHMPTSVNSSFVAGCKPFSPEFMKLMAEAELKKATMPPPKLYYSVEEMILALEADIIEHHQQQHNHEG